MSLCRQPPHFVGYNPETRKSYSTHIEKPDDLYCFALIEICFVHVYEIQYIGVYEIQYIMLLDLIYYWEH